MQIFKSPVFVCFSVFLVISFGIYNYTNTSIATVASASILSFVGVLFCFLYEKDFWQNKLLLKSDAISIKVQARVNKRGIRDFLSVFGKNRRSRGTYYFLEGYALNPLTNEVQYFRSMLIPRSFFHSASSSEVYDEFDVYLDAANPKKYFFDSTTLGHL